jgi:Ca2+-binding RTX toxin-like protein
MATVTGTGGGDLIQPGTPTTYGSDGADLISGLAGNDTIYSGSNSDRVYGGADRDLIDGGTGADTLYGDTGNDTIYSGTDDAADRVYGGDGDDYIYESDFGNGGEDSIVGGLGIDTVDFSAAPSGINLTLVGGGGTVNPTGNNNTDTLVGIENIVGTGSADTIIGDDVSNLLDGGGGADSLSGQVGNDTLIGGDGNDTLLGGVDNDLLFGGAGTDRLEGGSGADTLVGGAGADVLIGGVGSDTADYSTSAGAVNVNINDAVAEAGGDAAGDALSGIENLIGSAGNDTLTGNGGANEIQGGDGADSITGHLGSDSIDGGSGNDTINAGPDTLGGTPPAPTNERLDWTTGGGDGDTIASTFTQDTGTMSVTVNYVPGVGNDFSVETDAIYSPETLIGNNSGASLGRPGAGELTELSVNFAAESGSGMTNEVSNVLFRISDIDTGGFTDTVTILAYDELGNTVPVAITTTSGEISIVGNTATATGNGTTQSQEDGSILISIPGPVSQIVIQYSDLDDANQRIVVSDVHFTTIPATPDTSDADTVSGGLGDDAIETGIGADLVSGDEGRDTLRGEAGSDTLYGGTENDLVYGGSENDLAYGGADQDTLYGDAGNDTLYGDAGNDSLFGGDNADLLYGGLGLDTLLGDAGNDTLLGDAGNDVLTGGAGSDLVFGGDDRDLITMTFDDALGNETVDGGSGAGTTSDNDTLSVDITGFGWTRFDINYDPLDNENGTIIFYGPGPGFPIVGTLVFTDIENLVIVCFTPGTQILTERGAVAVEALAAGDLVVTRDNGLQPLRWVGSRRLSYTELLARPALQPVRIAAGALAGAGPDRTMLVSPQHRVLIEGARAEMFFGEAEVLVPAKHLTGLAEVTRALPAEGVTYVHILFDRHEIVQSDGIWTESFQPAERTLSGLDDAARAEVLELFPELAVGATGFPAARLSLRAHEAKVLVSG